MIVSWNWLKDYVSLDMPPAEAEQRLAMAGLNHEGTESFADDLAIDLEVTSNRPDCLGHIGVARELAVLYQRDLKTPDPQPHAAGGKSAEELVQVRIDAPELCQRYTARVIRGVKIGPSPDWLQERLRTIGVGVVNNVVDITNYVLMECGQPLHAFDLATLKGPEVVVREAAKDERFEAIDHKDYTLEPGMCVIADSKRAIALGGVMGGADTEVSDSTTELLIEAAEFAPLSIRTTARKLNLHSPSSYRFERGVDPEGIDWASRRCCKLILDLTGGDLAPGVVDEGRPVDPRPPVVLRFGQLKRILGIEVGADEVERILRALGGEVKTADDAERIEIVPPTWRRDLDREIDLVEEVARIHGYEEIPEDVGVPMAASYRTDEDRVLEQVRRLLTAAGFDEAMTASVTPNEWEETFSPWTDASPLVCSTPMLKGADRVRRSLTPSLLESRRVNESLANPVVELFETARIYLPRKGELPAEQWTLALTSGGDYFQIKGVLETLIDLLAPSYRFDLQDTQHQLLDPAKSAELRLNNKRFGFLGEVSQWGLEQFGLRSRTTVAEVNLGVLAEIAQLVPQHREVSQFPSIARDLNLIVNESVRWADLAATVREAAGKVLEDVAYLETYRDPKKDGANTKRLLFSISLNSPERTLTGEEADAVRSRVVDACDREHGARLLAG